MGQNNKKIYLMYLKLTFYVSPKFASDPNIFGYLKI